MPELLRRVACRVAVLDRSRNRTPGNLPKQPQASVFPCAKASLMGEYLALLSKQMTREIIMPIKNIAVACQGGGSHAAYAAGALPTLLPKFGNGAIAKSDANRKALGMISS